MRPTLLILAMILSGCVTRSPPATEALHQDDPTATDAGWHASFRDNASGMLAIRLTNAAPVSFALVANFTWDVNEYNPLFVAYLAENGTLTPLVDELDIDTAHLGNGDGVVHAGAGDLNAQTPRLTPPFEQSIAPVVGLEGVGNGVLLVSWANLKKGVDLALGVNAGTTIQVTAGSSVRPYELKSMERGARAGTPLLTATALDGTALAAEGQVFGYVKYYIGDASAGSLRLKDATAERTLPLGRAPAAPCSCIEQGRVVFTATPSAEVEVTLVGFSPQTDLFVVAGAFPEGTLPEPLWLKLPM